MVKLRWDARNTGVQNVEIVAAAGGAPGSRFVARTTQLAGEREFVTDRSGRYEFVLSAWNAEGQPLHLERIAIDIPGIRGVGR